MADINTHDLVDELHRIEQVVTYSLASLENYLRLDFTKEEKGEIKKLHEVYQRWDDAIKKLIALLEALEGLGYPNLPRAEVPQTMKDATTRERNQNIWADDLFYVGGSNPPAVAVSVFVGEPQKQ